LIVDTAGRLAIDDEMMNEIRGLHAEVKPAETLFVVDAMTGQVAALISIEPDNIWPFGELALSG
jgi:signal recognition particle subunit SRP54